MSDISDVGQVNDPTFFQNTGYMAPVATVARNSPTIGHLVEALCKAQQEFTTILKANLNPQFKSKYADLSTIIQATMPALAKNGLAMIQMPSVKGRELTMTTMLVHSSGEWISNDLTIPATMRNELTAQTIGSACTYSRRYAMQSILGIAADLDDDGQDASGGGSKEQANGVAKSKLEAAGHIVSLFYVHHEDSDMYEVTGDHGLKEANRDLLKKFWSPVAGAIMLNGEQLEDLKYMLEERKVPFKLLKGNPESAVSGAPPPKSNLSEQLKASIKAVAEKKKL